MVKIQKRRRLLIIILDKEKMNDDDRGVKWLMEIFKKDKRVGERAYKNLHKI
jgi:hypothetical protein